MLLASLSVGDGTKTTGETGAEDDNAKSDSGSGQNSDPPSVSPPMSPTLRAVQEMESAAASNADKQSAVRRPRKDAEDWTNQRHSNPHKQSRSFQMLEQGLRLSQAAQGASNSVGD